MAKSLPLIKFPTLVVAVDDNVEFLDNFRLVVRAKTFSIAQEACDFIAANNIKLQKIVKENFPVSIERKETEKAAIDYDIHKVHHLIYDPKRFDLPIIMVIDYAMPGMNGLELSEKLKNYFLGIIMLTGEAGFDLAVSGFNVKLINRFILKSDPDYFQKIEQAIDELENEIFCFISSTLKDAISGGRNTIFDDDIFIEFFGKFVKDHQIVEYYLLDTSGSYLLLDANGKIYWLIVRNEEDMRWLYELAADDPEVPVVVTDSLKKREKVVFFPSERHQLNSAKYWPLIDAKELKGDYGTYYYGVVEGTDNYYKLQDNEIISYKAYLKNIKT